jgi:2-methylcitrate dehydratase PrpD
MLNTTSQLLLNSLKPYSACQLTHAPIDAARQLREQIGAAPIESIKLWVNPLAIEIAGIRDARTATQGRFSTGYCVALAMHGYPVSPSDFVPERLADAKLIDLAARVTMEGTTEIPRTAVRLEARLADGRTVKTDVEHAFGSAGNPMDWAQLELKFQSLVEPAYGNQTAGLYELLANFERPGALNKLVALANKLAPI